MMVVLASIEQLANRDVHGSDQDGFAPLARVLEAKGQDGRQLRCSGSVPVCVNPWADHGQRVIDGGKLTMYMCVPNVKSDFV